MTDEDAARLLLAVGRNAWSAVLMASGSLQGNRMYEWMRNPKPGQLVFGSTGWLGNPPINCVGYLKLRTREPITWQDETGLTEEDRKQTEEVWYIKTLDGRDMRWTNEVFYAVPDSNWNEHDSDHWRDRTGSERANRLQTEPEGES